MHTQTPSHYTTIVALFVAVLLISNITSTKIIDLWVVAWLPIVFDGGTLLFPLSYIFGDILTEVYGYAKAKRAIRLWFICATLLSVSIRVVWALPADPTRGLQDAYQSILGYAPRIVLASLIAYLIGEFANAKIMSRMKWTTIGNEGLWKRALWSTIVGQWLDTVVFVIVAFAWVLPRWVIGAIIATNYIFKVLIEVVLMPVTYRAVAYLRK